MKVVFETAGGTFLGLLFFAAVCGAIDRFLYVRRARRSPARRARGGRASVPPPTRNVACTHRVASARPRHLHTVE